MLNEIVTKRFLFDGSKVAALRDEVGNGPSLDRPTRFIAVSSLILAAMMTITRENEVDQQIGVVTIPVNLRGRLKPPVPKQSIGNIFQMAKTNWPKSESNVLNYNSLAGKLDESIRKMNDEYIRKFHAGGGYFNFIQRARKEAKKALLLGLVALSHQSYKISELRFKNTRLVLKMEILLY
ncbi:VINORINE SYNTHASE-LIKE [Salix koriyanagi]|uniref:VINORINE SYNTHASE-LIKE n=1 Tax=Salix koriyanagi TaxID=2511006 RepID=A0A9Q0ZUX6_9ROSI|nr:VINORINE SYNTHASE-LIKE [Salix koriyanagi]